MIVALCPLDNAFDTAANAAAIDVQLERAARASNFRRPDENPPRQNVVVMGGSLAVAPDGTLLHSFEPQRREPLLIRVA